MTNQAKELLAFVRALPQGYAYAPIYAKGSQLPSGHVAKGKEPLGRAHHQIMGPADVLLQIERQPELFQAVGVFTGPRSKGLVILDVDLKLGLLLRKCGETLEGAPRVTSTKKNAAKYLFRVPEEYWNEVKGFPLVKDGPGYEVLWNRQGLLYGAYPGSKEGTAPEGYYGFEGDLEAIPEAPAWLIAEMRDAATRKEPVAKGLLKNRKALDFSDRTQDEIAEIVQDCLRVIPHQGAHSRDHWVQVGMAIHDALPNEVGLTLWSAWSADDPEYADDWKEGNPCEVAWRSFKQGGGIRFNSLIWMADQQDPMRRRFSDSSRDAVASAEARTTLRVQTVSLPHEEIVQRAKAAMQLPNPSEVQHVLHEIAIESKYKDAAAVVRLLIADQEYRRGSNGGTLKELLTVEDDPIEYLIPGLLPSPGTLLVHGRGGCGKTMAVMTLAKHIARGIPFSVSGAEVPVEPGKVLWLNGDQNSRRLKRQFKDLDFTEDDPVVIENKVSMLWYPWFQNIMEKHRPKLVVWDSVTACMRGCAYDQNKAEYAEPIYWYSSENGESFPATTIVFIHHANKEGGFRGTTALEDAVDESWAIKKPDRQEIERVGAGARLVTIGKSREGNEDRLLLLRQKEDLTFELKDCAELSQDSAAPASVIDRVLHRLRTHGQGMSMSQMYADSLIGGNVAAIKKAVERLVDRGYVKAEGTRSKRTYRALLAGKADRVGGFSTPSSSLSRVARPVSPVPNEAKPNPGTGFEEGTGSDLSLSEGDVSLTFSTGTGTSNAPSNDENVRDTKGHEGTPVLSDTNGFEPKGQGTGGRVKGSSRSKAQLQALMTDAAAVWDDPDERVLARVSPAEVAEANIDATAAILKGDTPGVVDVTAKTVQ